MPAAVLIGEPDGTDREAEIIDGLMRLEALANGTERSMERIVDVGKGVSALYERGFHRGVGSVATSFMSIQKQMPIDRGDGVYSF